MGRITLFSLLYWCVLNYGVASLNLPGPLVYVVTPAPKSNTDEGRSAPFYYHNWMRRMDSPQNSTTTTTEAPPVNPDLIFADFESGKGDMQKSIRKLLEKETIAPKISTTKPIYVSDEVKEKGQVPVTRVVNYGLPVKKDKMQDNEKKSTPDMTDYFALYNNIHSDGPVYLPSTTVRSSTSTTPSTTPVSPTTTASSAHVEDIWHVIDTQKHDQYSDKWQEVDLNSGSNQDDKLTDESEDVKLDDNFALPGFHTNQEQGAENESRAIRTEPNLRYPYVNLKPFQIKTRPQQSSFANHKKTSNNMFSLDDFKDTKNPVRGEAQEVVHYHQPVDRYNPAQPYLPPAEYGSKSKQSSPSAAPVKTVANLVPPPPPLPPKVTGDDFPQPTSYDSFPPYPPDMSAPSPFPQLPKQSAPFAPPDSDSAPDTDDSDSGTPMDLGYRYKPPSPPALPFFPTLPPPDSKPQGYMYNKPSMSDKPEFPGYSYAKPPMVEDSPPPMEKPDVYHYSKPDDDHPPIPSYGQAPPHYQSDNDYPELIFDKPKGGKVKGGDDMKNVGGMAPPPPPDMGPSMQAPPNDHAFPADFTPDFKFHHDFDDHDFYHHHHHHPTTTTTSTTESPRVNRYSYYYLGKKLYYLPLYFSVYFIVYVGALIIKAVLRHKITYPNSWKPNDQTASFFSKRSVDSWDLSNDNLHELTGKITHAIGKATEKYMSKEKGD